MKIYMVKTNQECFITDCKVTQGYDYNYHKTKIPSLYFDRTLAQETYCKNWYVISKYPEKIERIEKRFTNQRFEIDDKEMICTKFPKTIPYEDREKVNFDIYEFYHICKDELPDEFVDADVEIEVILELDEFKTPESINYKCSDSNVTNKDIEHQLLDKLIFPEIMLHTRPCKLSSKQMYDITRQYIKDNIDLSRAKITSDYDFCFTVKKIVPLLEPETISYHDIFARTKRERNKIKYKTYKYKDVEIFQMTHDQEKYKNYTVIEGMCADSQDALKVKIDTWLKELINIINSPLELCPHCKGSGYKEQVEKIETNRNN